MAHNDEAGGSGGKKFWELSQEMEEQPHRYEDKNQLNLCELPFQM